jgi:hypothetical protein
MNIKFSSVLCFGALLVSSVVNASTIHISPTNQTIPVATTFTVIVQGTGFVLTNGGGFSLSWDTNLLSLSSSAADISQSLLGNGFAPNSITITSGQLDVAFTSFPATPVSGNFAITTLGFVTILPGVTDISFLATQPAWTDADNVALAPALQPDYVGASITILTPAAATVPLPAAIWLFSSGLLGLAGIARLAIRV